MSQSIAFIDTRVADYQTLIAGLPAGIEVILIDGGDGLQAMAAALAGRSNLDAIHVFSHGSAGALQLGDTTLSSANLDTYAPLLAQIGQYLTPQGDLLLYGCNVGAGETGQAFVESIARITQADVAASEDLTGNAVLGGDWVLEVATRTIEAPTLQATSYSGALVYSASLVADIYSGVTGQSTKAMAVLNNVLYFAANDSTNGEELWQYDGTNAPTMVADIVSGAIGIAPNFLTVFNGALYFQGTTSATGTELWKYDGTNAPTIAADINAGAGSGSPGGNAGFGTMTEFNGALYFRATDGTNGVELWKYDGTNATMVADINAGANSSTPDYLTVFNNALYFQATDGTNGQELWKYDGTNAPMMVANINTGASNSSPTYLAVFNNELYFKAATGTNPELWKYDGTNTPTIVAEINPDTNAGSSPSWLKVFNGALYFTASDGTHGAELMKYDGTNAPAIVANINPGASGSNPGRFTVFNNELYFQANDGTNGIELWKYDGTSAPTMVVDINSGSGHSSPVFLTPFNGGLYFYANDGTNGTELWQYISDNASPTVGGITTTTTINDTATTTPFSGVTIADTDANNVSITVTLDTQAKGALGTLGSFTDNGNGSYTLASTGAATAQAAIRQLVFNPTDNRVAVSSTEITTFTIAVNDGTATTTNATTTVTSTSVNDAPTVGNAAAGQAVNDNATVSPFSPFTIADVDPSQTQTVSVTLDTASNGSFTTLSGFTNAGGGVYSFSGTAAAAQTAIRGLVFTPTTNQVAVGSTVTTTFTVSVDDGVATAVTNNTTTVVATSINDAPVNTKPAAQIFNEDGTLTFSAGNGNALSVADADTGTTLTTVVSVVSGKGTLAVTTGGGGTITGDGSNSVQIVGTVAQVQNALGAVTYTPTANASGNGYATLTLQSTDGGALADTDTVTLNLIPIADTPSVTNASTTPAMQTSSGLVLSRNAADGAEVTHFKITGITNGNLFQADGTTAINHNDFITFAEGNAGLKFTPTGGGDGSFTSQASTSSADGGLGGSTVNATIAVGAAVASPTVNEDTDSGAIAITLGGSETHYKITSISGGTLFSDASYTAAITNGSFIASAGATTNVYFRPTANANTTTGGNGSFVLQASTSNADGGLTGSQLTSTVTLTAVADTPSVTNASARTGQQNPSGLVLSRNAADGDETTHFKISGITGGTLYKADGVTAIANNAFITYAEGHAGLKFTATGGGNGSFNVEASTNGTTVAGSAATTTITLDNTAPTINASGGTPVDDATGISVTADIVLPFTEALTSSSDLTKIYLKDVTTDTLVPATFSLNGNGQLVINPNASLAYSTAYYITWDANALKDAAGNAIAALTDETTFNFTTAAAPPAPDPGPSTPTPTPTPVPTPTPTPTPEPTPTPTPTPTPAPEPTPTPTPAPTPTPPQTTTTTNPDGSSTTTTTTTTSTVTTTTDPTTAVTDSSSTTITTQTTATTDGSGQTSTTMAETVIVASTVDGADVRNTTVSTVTTVTDPATGQQQTVRSADTTTIIAPVDLNRVEDDATNSDRDTRTTADVALVETTGGQDVLAASLPPGVGIQATGPTTAQSASNQNTLRDLVMRIDQCTEDGSIVAVQATTDAETFLQDLASRPGTVLTTRTIVPNFTGDTAPNQPITLTGNNDPTQPVALIIDVSQLPPGGTKLHLNNVAFAVIVGNSTVEGGEGPNIVIGDHGRQTIILGADDDELHGGGGDDTVASKTGNDKLYGDEGNDYIVGGVGNDLLEGGAGNDILQGGASDAGTWEVMLNTQGQTYLRFTATDPALTDTPTYFEPNGHIQDKNLVPLADSRAAFLHSDMAKVETIALLYQAVLGRLPDNAELNHWARQDLSSTQLAELAYTVYTSQNVSRNPDTTSATETQVRQLIEDLWGSASADMVRIGTDYIAQGGSWAEGLLYLAHHANHKTPLLDAYGQLPLMQPLTLGETGWSAMAGNDQLNGGDGHDRLIGGSGNNILDGGDGIDIVVMPGNVAHDYALGLQETAPGTMGTVGTVDLVLKNVFTGDLNILRNIELGEIGGVIYGPKADMPPLVIGEYQMLANFVQVVGTAELQALGVPTGWV